MKQYLISKSGFENIMCFVYVCVCVCAIFHVVVFISHNLIIHTLTPHVHIHNDDDHRVTEFLAGWLCLKYYHNISHMRQTFSSLKNITAHTSTKRYQIVFNESEIPQVRSFGRSRDWRRRHDCAMCCGFSVCE